jgi:hypothetical protein
MKIGAGRIALPGRSAAELLKDEERFPALRDVLRSGSLPRSARRRAAGPGLADAEFINITAQNLSMPEAARQDLLERNSMLSRARALVEQLEQR